MQSSADYVIFDTPVKCSIHKNTNLVSAANFIKNAEQQYSQYLNNESAANNKSNNATGAGVPIDFIRNPILKINTPSSHASRNKSHSYYSNNNINNNSHRLLAQQQQRLQQQQKTVNIVTPIMSPTPTVISGPPTFRSNIAAIDTALKSNQSDLLKTQLKKEQLETEIEILENKAKLKRQELRHSIVSPPRTTSANLGNNRSIEYDYIPNRLSAPEAVRQRSPVHKSPVRHTSNANVNNSPKNSINYEDVVRLMSERDALRNKLIYDKSAKEIERREIEHQLYETQDDFVREQKVSRERAFKLETELETAQKKLDETAKEKDDLHAKVVNLENRIIQLQQDLSKKERESFNSAIAENTERHLTNLCQTLTNQLEDVRDQLRLSEERYKRLESDLSTKVEKFEALRVQNDSLKKESESHLDGQAKIKRAYEEQLSSLVIKEKDSNQNNASLLKQKDDEIYQLKVELVDLKNKKINKQEYSDSLLLECRETISKQDQEIQLLAEALRAKQIQCDNMQRDFEYSLGPHIEERIQKEKQAWEQEQNYLIRRELSKLSEEKNKEIARCQEELLSERDKNIKDRERMILLEKETEELKQELKFSNKEKSNAINKAKESMRAEIEKIKEEILNEKFDEVNRYKRIIKELQEEIEQCKAESYQHVERDKELLQAIEKLEKNLIKDLNDEQRKISSLVPGLVPKIVNYSNLRSSYSVKNMDTVLSLNTFHIAFGNLRAIIDEVSQHYQSLKNENEVNKKSITKLNQEKEDGIESVKRQYERQKQKDLETIREYVQKDHNSLNNYTTEVGSLVSALKNKDNEIQEIQENMTQWKQETLGKLAEKFEVELNRELDRRMQEYKVDSAGQQLQLDKIRKEMDSLVKECRDASRNLISQDAHERMINYYKSRMEDFRNENLSLRQRLKSTNSLQQQVMSVPRNDDFMIGPSSVIMNAPSMSGDNLDDEICGGLLYTPSIDGDGDLYNKNEALQQRLNELEKLQAQLNNAQL